MQDINNLPPNYRMLTSCPSGRAQMGHGSGFTPPVDLSWDWSKGVFCDQITVYTVQDKDLSSLAKTLCAWELLSNVNYLLQIGEIQKLAQLLLELRFSHRLVIQELDSILLYLNSKQTRVDVKNAIKTVKREYYILGHQQKQNNYSPEETITSRVPSKVDCKLYPNFPFMCVSIHWCHANISS